MARPTIYSNSAAVDSTTTHSSGSLSFTVPSGRTDPALLVWLTVIDNSATPSQIDQITVKWGGSGGTAMTMVSGSQSQRQANSRTIWGAFFYLLDPTVQTSTIYWETAGSALVGSVLVGMMLEHVPDTGTIAASANGSTASGTSVEASITGTSNDSLTLYGFAVRGGNLTATITGATELREDVSGADATLDVFSVLATEDGASGSQTATADWSEDDPHIWSAIQVEGAASGPTYTLTCTTQTYTLTGVAATPKAARLLTAAARSYTLTGNAASMSLGYYQQVNASNRDASQVGSTVSINNTIVSIQSNSYLAGFYFDGALPPSGSTITSAVLQVYVNGTSYDDPDVLIYAGDADTGTVFAATDNFLSNITPTTAQVAWSASSIGAGWQSSPDISAVIQEVVDRAGWDASSINLFMTGDDATVSSFIINTWDYSGNAYGAKLTITYDAPGTPDYTLTADTRSYTLTGITATPKAARKIAAAVGTFTLTGNAATLTAARTLSGSVQTYTLTGNATGLFRGYTLTGAAGSFALTGNATGLTAARTLAGTVQTYTLTGIDAGLASGRTLSAAVGTFTLTGNAAGLTATRTLTTDAGSFTLTGYDVAFSSEMTLSAEAGAFALTGSDAGLTAARLLAADVQSYTLTGNDAAFSSELSLAADAGSFTFTGNDAALTIGRAITAEATAFTLTGNAATFAIGRAIVAEAGAFTLTGIPIILEGSQSITGEVGAFTFTGNTAGLVVSRVLALSAGSYALTGNDAALARGYTLAAAAQSYTLTGTATGMTAARMFAATVTTYALIGFATGFATGTVATPNPDRTFVVVFDDRGFVVEAERRGFIVAAEPRTYEVTQ